MSGATARTARRRFLLAAALGAPALLGAASAAAAPKRRIHMVTWRGASEVERGFVDYWERQPEQVEFVWQDAAQSLARLAAIGADIVRGQPDLVFSWGTPATLGLAGPADRPHPVIGRRIPLVFAPSADPLAANIVASLRGHGRNISGVCHVAPLATQIEVMRAYRAIGGVGILYNRLEANSVANLAAWRRAGSLGGFKVLASSFPLDRRGAAAPLAPQELGAILDGLRQGGANWLYLGPDTHLFTQLDAVAEAARQRALPTFAAVESLLGGGAPVLLGLVSKFYQVGQFAAHKAQRMLRGEQEVPIDTLQRFSLIINLAVAEAIDAYPPMGLIDYAEFRR
jgi:putative ABC transport system substrate-binding protein